MDIQTLIITPLAGALIGYFTNWLAIKMLFRPHTEKKLFGRPLPFTPGLIPKERFRLSKKMADTVGKYLLTDQVLTEAFAHSDFEASLDQFIDEWLQTLRTSPLTLRDILDSTDQGQDAALRDVFLENATSFQAFLMEQTEGLLLDESLLPKLSAAAEFIEKLPKEHPTVDKHLKQLVGKTVEEGLGSWASIFINEEKVYQNLKKGLASYLKKEETRAFLRDELSKALPRWAAMGEEKLLSLTLSDLTARLDEKTVEKGKAVFRKGLRYLVEKGAVHVVEGMNIRKLVEDRINDFEVAEAEEIILSVVNKELNAITVMGGVLGFLIGFLPAFLKWIGL